MKTENQIQQTDNTLMQSVIAISENNDQNVLIKLQKFQALLHKEPDPQGLDKTPDGKAKTLVISYIEMLLDELFFGQWSLTDEKYQREFNEVVGSATLTVIHPISGREIKRVGFASIVITQDADTKLIDFNSAKKKNALDLSFPKLKSEILKNAASSLGKSFGRDMNRKKVDHYNPLLQGELLQSLPEATMEKLLKAAENGGANEVEKILELPFNNEQKEVLKSTLNKNKEKK